MVGYAPRGPMLGGAPQPLLGGQPFQPSLDFLTQIPQAIQSATGWQPGTTPQWMPDWLRNLSTANTAQQQATQQSLAALPPRYAMTPQDINTAMSLGMNADILAYHGSPYTFDAFDASKIGTGEGAQAYGHGLYFAERPGVAQSYANMDHPVIGNDPRDDTSELARNWQMAGNPPIPMTPEIAAHMMQDYPSLAPLRGDPDITANLAKYVNAHEPGGTISPSGMAALRALDKQLPPKPTGSLYKVDIQPDPEHFLDWDKPLSEQSPHVQDKLSAMGVNDMSQTGRNLVEALPNRPATSEMLRQAGIPGIRYLDQGSRAKTQVILRNQYREGALDDSGASHERFFASRFKENNGNLDQTVAQLQKDAASDPQSKIVQNALSMAQDKGNSFHITQSPSDLTHNYVVFDPKHIKILERNNQPIGPMLGAEPQLGK